MTIVTAHSEVIPSMGAAPTMPMGPTGIQRAMVQMIEWYQHQREHAVSPCRFFPSCSVYAHEAITNHGARRGGWLTVRRLSRCRPFGPSGYDPVPECSCVRKPNV